MSEESDRRGRRPHSQKRVRQRWVATVLNDAEYAHLMTQCEATGKKPSRLLRELVAGLHLEAIPRHDPQVARTILSLGNNWNQIARRVNSFHPLEQAAIEEMLKKMEQVIQCLS